MKVFVEAEDSQKNFLERGNFRFLALISYFSDIRESGLFSAMMLLSHSIAA